MVECGATPDPGSLPGLDRDALTPVVRAALGRPDAEVGEWTVARLHGSSSPTAGGVFRVAGAARTAAGTLPWTVVLKVIVARTGFEDPAHDQYWKREALAYGSGLLADLPGRVAAPHCYAIEERAWLWLEDVGGEDRAWPLGEAAAVARDLGVLAGARPEAALPDHPWLSRAWLRAWASHGATMVRLLSGEEQMALVLDPAAYRHPVVAAAFPGGVVDRMRRLWEARGRLLGELERLPRALTHGDVHPGNAFPVGGEAGAPRTVLIDWAFVGLAAVGEEIGHTGGSRAVWAESPREADRALFAAYAAGLREAGWTGDERAVRFAACTHMALRWAYRPTANAILVASDPGAAALGWDPEQTAGWAAKTACFALDRGEEAQELLAAP